MFCENVKWVLFGDYFCKTLYSQGSKYVNVWQCTRFAVKFRDFQPIFGDSLQWFYFENITNQKISEDLLILTYIPNSDTVGWKIVCSPCPHHCVKSVRIRSYSGSYFPAFGLSTKRYRVSLRIQSECGKIRTRITPNTNTFQAVHTFIVDLSQNVNYVQS